MTQQTYDLPTLGWSAHFSAQLEADDLTTGQPVRLTRVMRNALEGLGPEGPVRHQMTPELFEAQITIGDWCFLDAAGEMRALEPKSRLSRKAPGEGGRVQLIASNLDTVFITTSCNADFNIARLERYLILAQQPGVEAVVLLTKPDLCDDPERYLDEATRALRNVVVKLITATDADNVKTVLAPWCKRGQTIALLGSSGVGKTTITNTLTGRSQLTQSVRESDARGRHTTTERTMYPLMDGAWLIDTPGMRELGLVDVSDALDAVFDDITELAQKCKFRDCAHKTEPGCAVQQAIADGVLDPARLERWAKLQREDALNNETVAEARSRARKLNKLYSGGRARGVAKRRGTE